MHIPILAILLGTISAPASALPLDSGVRIAIPGQYEQADEVESGDGWWGIAPSGSGFTLESTTVTVSAVPAMYQSPDEELRGVSIGVPAACAYVAVVRGSQRFEKGPLTPTRRQERAWQFLYPGERLNLYIETEKTKSYYRLWAIGTAIVPEGSPPIGFHDYKLVLVQGSERTGPRQPIISAEKLNIFERPVVIWAGDLDRDGKPDLIVNRTAGESHTDLALFLSSAADDGELMGLVAQWRALGPC